MSPGDSPSPSDTAASAETRSSDSKPDPQPSESEGHEGFLTRFRTAQSGPLMFVREVLTSVAAVAAIGLVLFAISGVWPPMVAVESGSMQPNMEKGDLIFITEPGRFAPGTSQGDTGVVTYQDGRQNQYRSFGSYGSVVVYDVPGENGPPIIHRARFFVQDGENWYDEANESYLPAGVDNCEELRYCPAPHAGFVTKGDHNDLYDQASNIAPPVRPGWVTGVARLRIPYLGWIRLGFSGQAFTAPAPAPTSTATVPPPVEPEPAATAADATVSAGTAPTRGTVPTGPSGSPGPTGPTPASNATVSGGAPGATVG